jgi:hypothetical protein
MGQQMSYRSRLVGDTMRSSVMVKVFIFSLALLTLGVCKPAYSEAAGIQPKYEFYSKNEWCFDNTHSFADEDSDWRLWANVRITIYIRMLGQKDRVFYSDMLEIAGGTWDSTGISEAQVSPDKQFTLFSIVGSESGNLFLINNISTKVKILDIEKLVPDTNHDGCPAIDWGLWLDSKHILFGSTAGVFIYDIESGGLKKEPVLSNKSLKNPKWEKEGHTLVGLLSDSDGGKVVRYDCRSRTFADIKAVDSPDGRFSAFHLESQPGILALADCVVGYICYYRLADLIDASKVHKPQSIRSLLWFPDSRRLMVFYTETTVIYDTEVNKRTEIESNLSSTPVDHPHWEVPSRILVGMQGKQKVRYDLKAKTFLE